MAARIEICAILDGNPMEHEYMNAFLIETDAGVQGLIWADDSHQALDLALAELEDAGVDTTGARVAALPNYNLIFIFNQD